MSPTAGRPASLRQPAGEGAASVPGSRRLPRALPVPAPAPLREGGCFSAKREARGCSASASPGLQGPRPRPSGPRRPRSHVPSRLRPRRLPPREASVRGWSCCPVRGMVRGGGARPATLCAPLLTHLRCSRFPETSPRGGSWLSSCVHSTCYSGFNLSLRFSTIPFWPIPQTFCKLN